MTPRLLAQDTGLSHSCQVVLLVAQMVSVMGQTADSEFWSTLCDIQLFYI